MCDDAEQKQTTDRGTPRATTWDDEWFGLVQETEARLGRRICGAVGLDAEPCERASKHRSGRCTHHGGSHLSGAPEGNQNALIHGLYARRILTCGPHCMCWDSCPFAEEDLIDMPAKKRPNCPYEQHEYDVLTRGAIEPFDPDQPTPAELQLTHLTHMAALLHIMSGRAAAALAVRPLIETVPGKDDTTTTKIGAPLDAFLRLAREHRSYLRQLSQSMKDTPYAKPTTIADQLKPLLLATKGIIERNLVYEKGPHDNPGIAPAWKNPANPHDIVDGIGLPIHEPIGPPGTDCLESDRVDAGSRGKGGAAAGASESDPSDPSDPSDRSDSRKPGPLHSVFPYVPLGDDYEDPWNSRIPRDNSRDKIKPRKRDKSKDRPYPRKQGKSGDMPYPRTGPPRYPPAKGK